MRFEKMFLLKCDDVKHFSIFERNYYIYLCYLLKGGLYTQAMLFFGLLWFIKVMSPCSKNNFNYIFVKICLK